MGLNIRVNLTSEDVKENDVVEIDAEIEEKSETSKKGGTYAKYRVPVKLASGKKANLWFFQKECAKIVKAKGSELKDYVGSKLTLGLEQATDENEKPISTKMGKPVMNIVIKSVK